MRPAAQAAPAPRAAAASRCTAVRPSEPAAVASAPASSSCDTAATSSSAHAPRSCAQSLREAGRFLKLFSVLDYATAVQGRMCTSGSACIFPLTPELPACCFLQLPDEVADWQQLPAGTGHLSCCRYYVLS